MTYCAAWVGGGAAYLIADAAVTAQPGVSSRIESMSSFGEAHIHGPVTVQQERLKICPLVGVNAAMAFAGSIQTGSELQRIVSEQVTTGQTDLATGAAMIGSLGTPLRDLTAQAATLTTAMPAPAALITVMGLVQSYGHGFDLMSDGVGGPIAGIYADDSGIHWLPDVIYAFYDSNQPTHFRMVSAIIRGEALAVGSSLSRDLSVFPTAATPAEGEWKARWEKEARFAKTGAPDFVTFIDESSWRVTVVEMGGNRSNGWLDLGPANDSGEDERSRDAVMHPDLAAVLTSDEGRSTSEPAVAFLEHREGSVEV